MKQLEEMLTVDQGDGAEGWTVAEIMSKMGWGERRTRSTIKRLIAQGKWAHSGTKPATAINGRVVQSPAYRVVKGGGA